MSLQWIAGLYLLLLACLVLLRFRQDWWLSQHLFSSWGPRTDVRCMNRRELFAAGLHFLVLGLVCLLTILAAVSAASFLGPRVEEAPGLLAFSFLGSILTLMCAVAGLGLLAASVFRSRRWVRPADCGCSSRDTGSAVAPVGTRAPLPAPAPAPLPASASVPRSGAANSRAPTSLPPTPSGS